MALTQPHTAGTQVRSPNLWQLFSLVKCLNWPNCDKKDSIISQNISKHFLVIFNALTFYSPGLLVKDLDIIQVQRIFTLPSVQFRGSVCLFVYYNHKVEFGANNNHSSYLKKLDSAAFSNVKIIKTSNSRKWGWIESLHREEEGLATWSPPIG